MEPLVTPEVPEFCISELRRLDPRWRDLSHIIISWDHPGGVRTKQHG